MVAAGAPRPRRRLHLGLLTTLPPSPTGPAEFVAGALTELARACRITCFVDRPELVDGWLRERFRVRPLSERDDPSIDLLVYHVANNLHQVGIYDAAMEGPPGLLEIHDGSVHHALATRMLASDNVEDYRELLARTHGSRGDQLARLRLGGQPAGVELFMFDSLKDLLDRHLGAVVHNRYAAELIALRAPEVPTWIVPLSAPVPAPAMPKESLGLPPGGLVIAHFGFVTRPKRPFLLLGAFARLRAAHPDVHLLFAGEDDTAGALDAEIARLGLTGSVTVTGYLDRERMDALISSVDIVVSLRFPHVGETSATLGAALAAGRPVVLQETGSWAELPQAAVLAVSTSGDEEAALADALAGLVVDPGRRASLGNAARAYATGSLGAERYAAGIADAATAVSLGSRVPPSEQLAERRWAVSQFLAGSGRLTTATLLTEGWPGRRDLLGVHLAALRRIPPGRAGARLLDLGSAPALQRLLECVWGYEVTVGPGDGRGDAGGSAGSGSSAGSRPGAVAGSGLGAVAGSGLGAVAGSGLGAVASSELGAVAGSGLGYPTGTFDVVAAWDLLPGEADAASAFLAEANRVLRPGGLMVLAGGDAAPIDQLLERAGLSTEGAAPPESGPGVVAAARKVGLPWPLPEPIDISPQETLPGSARGPVVEPMSGPISADVS